MSDRKKILIVNNNMKIGGVQKALLEVLKELHTRYDVTLLLFKKTGALLNEIPEDVSVLESGSHFRYLGFSQGECRTVRDKLTRGLYAVVSKTLGIGAAVRIMGMTVRHECSEPYDTAVSFLHVGGFKLCYGGVAEYVLNHVTAAKKVCYIHCDYLNSGTDSPYSEKLYPRFDQIICVSESVRKQFIKVLPELEEKTITVPNPVDVREIRALSTRQPVFYEPGFLNLLTVARLAGEKGIARVIRALAQIKNSALRYYVVGDGRDRPELETMIRENGLEDSVFLVGEDKNPYRYMSGADLLVVPSYNEAAPVVFQEALVLGLPILSTRTLSAEEMIPPACGFVVDNTDEAICQALGQISQDFGCVREKKEAVRKQTCKNQRFIDDFQIVL